MSGSHLRDSTPSLSHPVCNWSTQLSSVGEDVVVYNSSKEDLETIVSMLRVVFRQAGEKEFTLCKR